DPSGAEATTDYSAAINWGDGSATTGTITLSGVTFTVSGSHSYSEEGSYPTSVTIRHDTATPTTVSGSAVVSDPAVVGSGVNFTATPGVALMTQAVATFTDPAGAEAAADYAATISWGDGSSPSPGTITFSNGVF